MKRGALIGVVLVLMTAGTGCGASADSGDTGHSPSYEREVRKLKERRAEERQVDAEVEADLRRWKPEEAANPKPPLDAEPATDHSSGRPLVDKVRRESREFCSIFPQSKIAREYGVPNDLSSVAAAYGGDYRSGLQVVAEGGCIEGLTE